jgi:lysophospholipase L1-like esterase
MKWRGVSFNPFTLPLLLAEGWWVRRNTPRLPDAAGPIEGLIKGCAPAFDLIVLGESPVAGIGAPTHRKAITGQTAQAIHQATGRTVRWLALGLSGATVRRANRELVPRLAGRRAASVVLAFGVNDALEQRSAQVWTADLRQMIADVRTHLGHVPIVLAGVPPLNECPAFPARLAAFLGQRSRLLDQAAAALAAALADVTYVPMINGLRAKDFCADRFHPSVSGHAAWGAHLARVLLGCNSARPSEQVESLRAKM